LTFLIIHHILLIQVNLRHICFEISLKNMDSLLPGMLAGMVSSLLFYPLECIETQMQLTKQGEKRGSLLQTLSNAYKREGLSALYKGAFPTVIGSGVNWALFFALYESLKNVMGHPESIVVQLVAGVIAGAITCCVVNPFWVLKIRIISGRFHSTLNALNAIVSREGLGGLWKGLGPSLLGTSEGAIQLVVYEMLKSMSLKPGMTENDISGLTFFLNGAIAKTVAMLITYPYQSVRSMMQADNAPYRGLVDCVNTVYERDGIGAFYNGIVIGLARQVLPAALLFYLVEFFKKLLHAVLFA